MNKSILVIILSLLILIFILYLHIYTCKHTYPYIHQNPTHQISFTKARTYYKCTDKHNPPSRNILNILGYQHKNPLTLEEQPELFIPCTYTNAERELKWTPAEMISKTNIFMVQGCDILAAKDTLWQLLVKKYTREGASRIMPETYITHESKDMALFYSRMNSEKSYILKKNVQRKEGLIVISRMMPAQIKNLIKQGGYLLIQEYISNPLVINTRKINLRVYVAVICKPDGDARIQGYLYKNGKCIYTNKAYGYQNIEDVESQITSVNMDIDIYQYNPETLQELSEYITPPKFAKMWKQITKKLQSVFQAISNSICQKEGFKGRQQFQLFGVDILLDTQLEPWILEFNKGPDMEYKTEKDEKMKNKLYTDLFCLVGLDSKCLSEITNWKELF
jgi:tubulin polyglutamylase TTLL4